MLINCVAYQDGAKLADIDVEAISDHLQRPGCFVWVALKDPTPEELAQMQHEFGLHELAVEDALKGQQRPKIEEYGNSLFVTMQMLELDPHQPGHLRTGDVGIFAGPNYVLSVRKRSNVGFLGVRQRAEREPELLRHGAGYVLYALMDAVVDRYFPLIEALEDELERIEEHIFEKRTARANVERLYELKRRVTLLKHAAFPLLEAAHKLQGGRVPAVVAGLSEYFRDVVDHLGRINASIDAMRETIGTAIQVNLSMVSIEDNEITKRLASWAAIFGVWTALAGVWGMNFEHMPELQWRFGYAVALGTIVTACGVLWWRFRKARWL